MILAPTVNPRILIFAWSATLIVSLAVSTYVVSRLWRHQISATAIGIGYALFGIVFYVLEGDTSKGTDLVQASVVYGTLMALPLIAFMLTWKLNRPRFAGSQQGDG